jgi:hypothetical protein
VRDSAAMILAAQRATKAASANTSIFMRAPRVR